MNISLSTFLQRTSFFKSLLKMGLLFISLILSFFMMATSADAKPYAVLSASVSPSPLNAKIVGAGTASAVATVTPSGGTAPYTYLWTRKTGTKSVVSSASSNSPTISAVLTSGQKITDSWSIKVTDAVGATTTITLSIAFTSTLPLSASVSPETLTAKIYGAGATSALATTTVSGGTSPYTYSWKRESGTKSTTTNATTKNATIRATLISGQVLTETWSVEVKDTTGATVTVMVPISFTSIVPLSASVSPDPLKARITAPGKAKATAVVTPVGGVAPYIYEWINTTGYGSTISNAAISNPIISATLGADELIEDLWMVTVTDSEGKTVNLNLSIDFRVVKPLSLSIDPVRLDATITDEGTATAGILQTNVQGGVAPYTYSWVRNGIGSKAAEVSDHTVADPSFSAILAAGESLQDNWVLTVTDADGLTISAQLPINFNSMASMALNLNTDPLTASIVGSGMVSVTPTVNVTGGKAPYTYLWKATGPISKISNSRVKTPIFSALLASGQTINDMWTLQVTDAEGTQLEGYIFLDFTSVVPLSLKLTSPSLEAKITDAGIASVDPIVEIAGGSGEYTFNWTRTTATASTISDKKAQNPTISMFLNAGQSSSEEWVLQVTDSNGLSESARLLVKFSSTETMVVSVNPELLTKSIIGAGTVTAAPTVSVTGGIVPYTYLWTPTGSISTISNNSVKNPTFSAVLASGDIVNEMWVLQVTDAEGTRFDGYVSLDFTSVVPLSIKLTSPTLEAKIIDGGIASVDANVEIVGGSGDYTFTWTRTTATASTISDKNALNPTISMFLNAGQSLSEEWVLQVTDSNGLSASARLPVKFSSTETMVVSVSPELLTKSIIGAGTVTAAPTVSVTGGIAPYTYLWTPTGSVSTISNNSSKNPIFSAVLAEGDIVSDVWTLQVTDAEGTQLGGSVSLDFTSVVPLSIKLTSPSLEAKIIDEGIASVDANVEVVGGSGDYTVQWTRTTTTASTISDKNVPNPTISMFLNAGQSFSEEWVVQVTDSNGLSASAQLPVKFSSTETLSINVSPEALTRSIIGAGLVKADSAVTVKGGKAPYSYRWSSTSSVPRISNSGGNNPNFSAVLASGESIGEIWALEVTDAEGMQIYGNVLVDFVSHLPLSLDITPNPLEAKIVDAGIASADVFLNVNGGSGFYTVQWSRTKGTGSTIADQNAASSTISAYLSAGQSLSEEWTVKVMDENGSTASVKVLLELSSMLSLSARLEPTKLEIVRVDAGPASVKANVIAIGGIAPYSYDWTRVTGNLSEISDATVANPVFTAPYLTNANILSETWIVRVTDASGEFVDVTQVIDWQVFYPLRGALKDKVDIRITGSGTASGSVPLQFGQGVPPYTVSWERISGGIDRVSDPSSATAIFSADLMQGQSTTSTWKVSVTDASGAKWEGATRITYTSTFPLTASIYPAELNASVINGGYVLRNVTLTAMNGTPPYNYLWKRVTGSRISIGTWQNFSAKPDFWADLKPNDQISEVWSVDITDAANNVTTVNLPINFSSTVPTLTVAINPTQLNANITGPGTASVSAAATVNGGRAPYTYLWTRINGTISNASNRYTKDSGFSAVLSSGQTVSETWQFKVTDSLGNIATANLPITFTSAALLTATVTPTRLSANINGAGVASSFVNVTANGGSAPYTYTWTRFNGNVSTISNSSFPDPIISAVLNSGQSISETWSVRVTDAKGATAIVNLPITFSSTSTPPPNSLSASVSPTQLNANIVGAGVASSPVNVTASGGSAPYTYIWTRFNGSVSTISNASNSNPTIRATLSAGQSISETWSVKVTDAQGVNTILNLPVVFSSGVTPPPPTNYPTIKVSRNPTPLVANQDFTTTTETTNATSLSYVCTADGTGFSGTSNNEPVGFNVRAPFKALASWVGYPSNCRWTAVGPAGTTEYIESFSTIEAGTPVLSLTIVSPNSAPNTSTNATVALGEQFTLRWNLAGVTSPFLVCTDGFTTYNADNISLQGERTFTTQPEWVLDRGIGCIVYASANGKSVSSSMVSIKVTPAPSTSLALSIISPNTAPNTATNATVTVGQQFTLRWNLSGVTNASLGCTDGFTTFDRQSIPLQGEQTLTARPEWVLDRDIGCGILASANGKSVSSPMVSIRVTPAPSTSLALSIISPNTTPNTPTNATVTVGQQFTLRWNLSGVTNATLGCHDGVASYDRVAISMQGERTFTARPEWALNRDISCSVIASANGTLVNSPTVWIKVQQAPPTSLTLLIIAPNNAPNNSTNATVGIGQQFTLRWNLSGVTDARLECTDGFVSLERVSIALQGDRTFTTRPEWAVGRDIGCFITATANGTSVNSSMVWIAIKPTATTIKVTRSAPIVANQSFTTTWSTNGSNLSYSCTANGSGFNGSANVSINGDESKIAQKGWVGYPSVCTWTATGAGGTTTITEILRTDPEPLVSAACLSRTPPSGMYTASLSGGEVWGNNSNGYTVDSHIGKALVHAGLLTNGASGAITITPIDSVSSFVGTSANGIVTTSYGSPGCAMKLSKTTISTAPSVTLQSTNSNVRIAQGQLASVKFIGQSSQSSGQITKLELLQNNGSGYNGIPVNITTGSASNLSYSYNAQLVSGSYRFKLRATNQSNLSTDSNEIIVNVTDSSLLGEISGIRSIGSGSNQKLELTGWACQDTNTQTLNYKVYADAPSILGGIQIASGVANIATENNQSDIENKCHTPGVGHYFVADLSNLSIAYQGKRLFVEVANDNNTLKATLPCADNNCTMPGAIRIGLTTPQNNDRYTGPAIVFMRAKIDNGNGIYDELAFNINGEWINATPDNEPGTYSAMKVGVPSRATPYPVVVKVRQGNTTIYSSENLIYVDAVNNGVSLKITKPANNLTVNRGTVVDLSAYANILQGSTAQIYSVKFYVNNVLVANGVNAGNGNWNAQWTPSQVGGVALNAKAFDQGGTLLRDSGASQIVVNDNPGPPVGDLIPVILTLDYLTNPDAGSLPGSLSVTPNGAASYSIPLDVPPGTAGVQPKISLDYSSQAQNSRVGLGWSLGGFSSIHRCGKTIAQDGINGRVGFDLDDRLCLDGQRLVLVSGDTTNNAAYWADGAEFRTELENFTKIVATGAVGDDVRAYEARTKDGRISIYGGNNTSTVKAIIGTPKSGESAIPPNPKNGAQSWALNSVTDRSGNYIRYAYEQDGVAGEHRPKFIRYGGNGLASHAAVEFMYEGRQDAWTRYIDETRNDLRSRLTQIKTYIGNNLDGSVSAAGTWVRETNLNYEYSPTSGRSLLQSVKSCGRNPSTSERECLPETTFNWGKPDPSKIPGFVSRGFWSNAPVMTTHNGPRSVNHADYFAFTDFENHGFTDVLEKRVASPGEPSSPDRDSYIAANPIPTGALRNQYRYFHNTGNGFIQYPYRLDTNEAFAVMEIGDFDGNGAPDIVVATGTVTKICISPLGNGIGARSEVVFTCASQQERPALGRNFIYDLPYVIDIKGDGRSALYSHISDRSASAKLYIQNQKIDDTQPPYSVLGYEFPHFAFEIPEQAYTSFTQMVDFSGTGKATDVRWTIPRFRDYYTDDEGTFPLMRWENLAPQIVMTSFRVPGTAVVGQMTPYSYPEYHPDCQRPECGPIAPYHFDAPYSGGSVSADFNGSGYSNLIFGFVEVTTNPVTRFNYASRAEMTLCLSTGRALDCGIRKKYSGTNYQTVRAVGNFVGDGQPSVLVETTANLPDRQPVPQGDIQLCSVRGDDTTQGNGTNDTNLICTPWTGPKLLSSSGLTIAENQIYFMDLLGTGRTQLVLYHAGKDVGNTWQEDGRWEVFEPTDLSKTGEALDRIVSVTNGLNATSTVEYADGIASGVVTTSGNSNLTYPLRPSPNIGKIVTRITHSNGVSGVRRTSFKYEDAAIDVSGRGSLGFAKFIATDEETGIKNTTSFKQGWPFTGMVDTYRSETTGSNVVTLVNTINQWKAKSIPQNSGSTTFVYLEQSDTQLRDLKNYDLGRTETVSRYTDQFGNLNSQTVKVIGNNQTLTTDTSNGYRNDTTCWAIGLPLTSSVTKSDSLYAGSITRRIDREYETCKLLPMWETVEKGNTTLELTTVFDRSGNAFGLVNNKTETWFDPDPANSGPKSRVSSIRYDAKGRYIDTVTNALNHQESHVYDEGTGARTRLTGPNGLATNWRINAFGRVTVELRADGNETRSYIKDCRGGCPLGATIVQISDQFNGAARISVPQLSYSDNAGHIVRTQSWGFDGKVTVTDQSFDQLGRLEHTYHPRFENAQAFKSSSRQYDVLDRVIESTNYDSNGESRRTTTSYDGYVTTMINPRNQTRIETHNVAKQLVQVQDANNGFTKFSYDPFGNLSKTIDPENNEIVVAYDTLGRKTTLIDPDLGTITYKVNPLGQTWAQISPKQRTLNQQTRFVFDKLGRMTGRFETDLESHWIFDTAANGKGQLAEAYTGTENAAPTARTYRREHTYDDKGRPKTTTQSLRDANYTHDISYDAWGRTRTLSYTRSNGPTKSFLHRFNGMGYLAKIERAGLTLWQVTQQDASHRVTQASLGNGLTQNRVYNPYTARLDAASLKNALGEARVQEGYQYDSLGNVEHRQQYWSGAADGFQEHYTYDSLNRLETTTMNNDTNGIQVFAYDKTGNIKRKPNVSSGDYVYPTQGAGSVRPHAVSSIPGVGSFSYDANGNLESGAGRSITWKSFDMPFSITKGEQYSEFIYGPEHQRTYQTRNGGGKTEYAGAQEVDSKDGILTIKTYWPGGLGVEIDKGNEATKLLWMHQDRLGSQIAITDETGALKEKLAYDAWGKRLNLNGVGTPDNLDGVTDNKGYTGHEMLDQLDLVHMNGRVYDPLVARFVSADPILQDPMNGQSYNRFAYVLNNPTNLTDPTGFASTGCGSRTSTDATFCTSITYGDESGTNSDDKGKKGKPSETKPDNSQVKNGTVVTNPKNNTEGNATNGGSGVSGWFSEKWKNTKERFSNLFSGGPFSTNAQIDEYGQGFAAAKAQGPAALAEYIRHHPAPGLAAVETVATMGASTLERGAIQQAEKMIALSKGESVAVLGHFPAYTKLAKELNAEVFDVGSKWLTMNTAQRWAANKAFLDSGIERGIPFILATEIRPGMNYFRAEVQYLMKNGYEYGTVGGMKALVKVP